MFSADIECLGKFLQKQFTKKFPIPTRKKYVNVCVSDIRRLTFKIPKQIFLIKKRSETLLRELFVSGNSFVEGISCAGEYLACDVQLCYSYNVDAYSFLISWNITVYVGSCPILDYCCHSIFKNLTSHVAFICLRALQCLG